MVICCRSVCPENGGELSVDICILRRNLRVGFKLSGILEPGLLVKDTECRTSVLEGAVVLVILPEFWSALAIWRRGQISFEVWKILGYSLSRAQLGWCVLEGGLSIVLPYWSSLMCQSHSGVSPTRAVWEKLLQTVATDLFWPGFVMLCR